MRCWRRLWLALALVSVSFQGENGLVHGYHQSADPYSTLGISRGASEEQIKRAYKKLAIKYHPDKNTQGNQEAAKENFVRIQEAYESLTTKRPSSSPQSRYSSYHQPPPQHQYHQQQHQYYHYSYSSQQQQRPPSSTSSTTPILYFFVLGVIAMYIYTKVTEDDDSNNNESTTQSTPPTPPSQRPSTSPFASLAATYAPHVQELTPELLQTKRRRVVIFCMRKSPSYCSRLGVIVAVTNQSKFVPFTFPVGDMSYSDLQGWLGRLVGKHRPQSRC
ncbi:hypothetical protein DYB30_008260 [Aphanomyces astaci]|uniref:J domain-containing protein n=1 Tax=Aphanomyces astaci TaxID=112090 RepID=A0A397DZ33_APHAT|nr:hypothetical protein DYB38_011565 [Aphanomyces astaci]RHY73154.1 hypothetical protein DYB30_008260 [Aphanomyces astaci]